MTRSCSCVTTSRPTTRSKVTCAARSPRTSGARSRSAATQGIRHRRGLPVRGQRTRTNARTRKGPKRTVAGKKKPARSSTGPASRSTADHRQYGAHTDMPPKARTGPAAAKKVRRKERKNVAHGQAHIKSTFNNTIVSITDPTGAVISWASAGQVGFKGSRKSTPFAAQLAAEAAARRAMEHGMRKVDVFVKGPGSGRETAIRSLRPRAGGRARSPTSRRSRTTGAVRLSVVGSRGEERDMARYTGADCRRCRREKMKLFLKGSKCDGPKCPFESRPFPPGQHGRGRTKESGVPAAAPREAEGPPHLRRAGEAVPRLLRRGRTEAGKTGEDLLQILESRLDNVVYRAGLRQVPGHARQLVKHGHFMVNGKKVDIPSYRVKRARHRRGPGEVRGADAVRGGAGRGRLADRAGVAGGDPQPDEDPRPLAPGPAGHRHPGPGAVDRRALLQVASGGPGGGPSADRGGHRGTHRGSAIQSRNQFGHQIAGAPNEKRNSAHHPAADSLRRVDQRDPVQVHHRAARARLRLHAGQLAPAYAARRRSRARPSPSSRSTACCTSSPRSPGSRRTWSSWS